MNTTPYSTTRSAKSEHFKTAMAVIFLMITIAAWVVTLILERQQAHVEEYEIPMANINVTWTGAGYSGIYGGEGK